jgi:predicted dienelactone hydrolase
VVGATALVATLVALAHLGLEGARWSLTPIYATTTILAIHALRKSRAPSVPTGRRRLLRAVLAGLGIAIFVVSTAAALLFPVTTLPAPPGPFPVGTTEFELTDSTRAESFTDDNTDRRRFTVRIWYPARAAGTYPAPYRIRTGVVGSILSEGLANVGGGTPNIVFSHLRYIKSHSFPGAPSAQGPFPVVVYSTGFTAPLDNGQLLAEALASHGWMVVSLSHPFESEFEIRADGRVDRYSAAHAEEYRRHDGVAGRIWPRFWATKDSTDRKRLAHDLLAGERFMDEAVRIRTADIRWTIDAFTRRQAASDPLAREMDFSRLAVVGHSLGGATAGQVLLTDARFRAGVNLDGFQFGDAVRDTIRRPFLVLSSQSFAGANDWLGGHLGGLAIAEVVPGTTHMNFTDDPVVLPVTRRLGMAGPIDPEGAQRIVADRVLAFLRASLPSR